MSQPNQDENSYKPTKRFNFMNGNASTEQNGRNMKNYSMTNDSTLQEAFYKQFGDGLFMEDMAWKDFFTKINQTTLENKNAANKTKNLCDGCCYGQEIIQGRNDWTKMCAGTVSNGEMDRLFVPQSENEIKYVLANWKGLCHGLGNQMWRFASLYGIGKPYGRRPIYTEEQQCLKKHGPHESEGENEISNLFPVMAAKLQYIVNFSRFKQKYVQITSFYFQSYKFFEARRHEIRQIFQFSPNVCTNGAKCDWDNCYNAELESHYFYLAFENSVCLGYVTEKFWNLKRLIVPVVLSRRVFEGYNIPGDSFIAADDFRNVEELADFCVYLQNNRTAYLSYFNWTKEYRKTHYHSLRKILSKKYHQTAIIAKNATPAPDYNPLCSL